MKTHRRHLLLAASGFVAVLAVARVGLTFRDKPSASGLPDHQAATPRRHAAQPAASESMQQPDTNSPALARALAESDPARRRTLLREWAASVDTAVMEETMTRIGLIGKPAVRREACRALLASWMQRDAEGVAGWFGQDGSNRDIEMRMEARDFLLEDMGKWEPERALSWLDKSLTPRARDLLYEPFFLQWASANPAAACAKLHELADGRLLGQVAARWAGEDLAGAVNWMKSLPEGPVQAQAMLEVSYRWTGAAPYEAATYAAQTGDPALLRAVVGKWADQSPQDAAAWVAEWPEGQSRDATLAHLAHIWAQNDLTAAASYAESLPAGAARDQAMVAVATVWAYAAPDQSAEWINRFAEGAAREQALTRLIGAWAGAKPEEAAQWIQKLPSGGSTDFAVNAYSTAIMEPSPKLAFEWAATITRETMRNQQLERVAGLWITKDQAAARRAITGSNLPENIKTRLLANAE